LLFITLIKNKVKQTKELLAEADKLIAKMEEEGVKFKAVYWTLGRFDAVMIVEAKDEKAAMKALLQASDMISSETLVAIPREEARKLIE